MEETGRKRQAREEKPAPLKTKGAAPGYDFNIYTRAKLQEKLHYMHSNPVRAKLAQHPGDWPWSSWCYYYRGEGLLKIDRRGDVEELKEREEEPTLCKNRKG